MAKETIEFTLSDLKDALENNKNNTTIEASNLLYLSSQSQVNGLKTLYDDQNIQYGILKQKYGENLLKDLENLSKRFEFTNNDKFPKFNNNFYEEFRSNEPYSYELKQFLTVFASYDSSNSTGIGINNPEIISAKILLQADDVNNNQRTIKDDLTSYLNEYKNRQQKQSIADFGGKGNNNVHKDPRTLILVKTANEIINVDINDLNKLESLSAGQKEFIKTSCHQGMFEGAITGGLSSIITTNQPEYNKVRLAKTNSVLLDLSDPNKILLRSRTQITEDTKDENSKTINSTPIFDSVIEADISQYQDNYIPGVMEKLPITFTIAIYDPKNTKIPLQNIEKQVENDDIVI